MQTNLDKAGLYFVGVADRMQGSHYAIFLDPDEKTLEFLFQSVREIHGSWEHPREQTEKTLPLREEIA